MRLRIWDSLIAILRKAHALEPCIHAPLQAYASEIPVPAGLRADDPGDLAQALRDFKHAFQIERAR